MKEVENKKDASYITDENGNELEIEIVTEFERDEDNRSFVVYLDKYPENEEDQGKYYVGEIITLEDGSEELVDVNDEYDMEYCQKMFDDYIQQELSRSMGDEDYDSIDDEEDVIVS